MLPNILLQSLRSVPLQRSVLVKAAGYRVLSVLVTVVIAFAVLGDISAAVDIGIWANVLKTGVYYAYERAWSGIDMGAVWAALSSSG